MDSNTRRSVIRNIVHGILIAKYHVPNFGYDKKFGADFGFNAAAFGSFLEEVADEVDRQLKPNKHWIVDDDVLRQQLNQTVTSLIDTITDAMDEI